MDSTKKKEIATHVEKLPWELIEEILSRVPPKSLVRFRTVSKQWKALFDDKMFINNHKSTFRFILRTNSKIYSVSIDPKIVVRELTLDIPGLESKIPKYFVDCDDFLLLCDMEKVAAVWNPWLNRTRLIKAEPGLQIDGIGYDNNKNSNTRLEEKVYKAVASYWKGSDRNYETWWKIYDFASDAWEITGDPGDDTSDQGEKEARLHSYGGVPLNGTLYWVAFYDETDSLYHLTKFDFSSEEFLEFCDLPCGMNHRRRDALVLRVFKGDRFSLLKQCHVTKKINIWVTKNKINAEDGDCVVWMNFMTFSIPNFPGLVQSFHFQPSYYIDDKKLVVCSCDETGQAWIYVVARPGLSPFQ